MGAGTWFRERALGLLRAAVLGAEAEESLLVTRTRVGEYSLAALLDAARTLPLGGARRFIVLAGGESLAAEELALLADYAARPQPTTCLVICADKAPGRSKAAQKLLAAAERVECPVLRPYEVSRWMQGELRRQGYRAEAGVCERLQEVLGDDPAELAQGLEKLSLYLGSSKKTVQLEDVAAVLERIPHGTVWEFVEALEEKDPGRTLRALDAILELGEPAESVLRLITRSRRQLLAGLSAGRQGAAAEEVLEAMGVHPKARAAPRIRKAILQRLAAHRLEEVVRSFPMLLAADSSLKGGGGGEPRMVLTRLVLDLTGGRGGGDEAAGARS
jgi:DNA polymerase-3 subunit delta